MASFPSPRILFSRCLGFDRCRYNGAVIEDEFVGKLREHVECLTICPEVEIGLGVPRDPIRIVLEDTFPRLVQPATGRDLTGEMDRFSASRLEALPEVDGFLLKNRSPSCGFKDVKHFNARGTIVEKNAGMFARAVMDRFPDTAIEDEGRLSNFTIREHFLIRIYASARFRAVRNDNTLHALVDYHAAHKLLLMAYNQTVMRELGRIVANPDRSAPKNTIERYGSLLTRAFNRTASRPSHINVLMHAFGYFSKNLSSEEKAFFLDSLERFRRERIPLSVLGGVIQSWIARFQEPYLAGQTYFTPYPEELMEITDSGKGRTY